MGADEAARIGVPWPHWSAEDRPGARAFSGTDDELQRLLDSLLAGFKAAGALLTLHVDGGTGPVEIGRAGKLSWAEEDWAAIAQLADGAGGARRDSRAGAEASDWISCLVNRRAWQTLRVPIGSRRGRSRVILSFLFRNPTPADRDMVLAMIRQLSPLIEGYFRLWQRSRVQAAAATGLRSALDMVDMGVVLLNKAGKVSFVNKAADVMLTAGDHVQLAGDALIPTDINDAVKLQVAINHALAGSGGQAAPGRAPRAPVLKLRPTRSERALLLCIFPCNEPATGPDEAALMLFMLDPNREFDDQLQPVCKLYGLSPVESRLVCLITGGASLQQAASTMRIKEQTARSYLKMIFMKTETKRQADLVRLMLCSLVRTKGDVPLQVVD
jgi:DNA-binding CsgD family transcriptional regulator/PAS domain-containing protein